jgi:hypothetical protein
MPQVGALFVLCASLRRACDGPHESPQSEDLHCEKVSFHRHREVSPNEFWTGDLLSQPAKPRRSVRRCPAALVPS